MKHEQRHVVSMGPLYVLRIAELRIRGNGNSRKKYTSNSSLEFFILIKQQVMSILTLHLQSESHNGGIGIK